VTAPTDEAGLTGAAGGQRRKPQPLPHRLWSIY
jgi:hypothetical protein